MAILLPVNYSPSESSANHNLSAEELPAIDTDGSLLFVVQSEGADQEIRVFKIVVWSHL